jgi:hypothetical protein
MGSNSRYLTLALDIRKLSNALIRLVEDDQDNAEIRKSIGHLLDSIENAGQKTTVKALRERGTFGQYENVITVNEVIKDDRRVDLIAKLQGVLVFNSPEQRKENALEAIAFFDVIERRALYHYNHPKTVRELR